jgi:hypothetical protein
MDLYSIFNLIIIPSSLCVFGIEYLSDSYITHSELKIGILDYLHHLVVIMVSTGSVLSLFVNNIIFTSLVIIHYTIAQIGYIKNNEYCWLTKYINTLINNKIPMRKWRGGFDSLIKHYIRGDDWAYSDIKYINNQQKNIYINTILIISLIRILVKKDNY